MKTASLRIAGLALILSASAAQAASVGGFVGTDAGVYYQTPTANGATRYGITALGLFSQGISVAGEADMLRNFGTTAPNTFGALTPYYGFGLGAGVALGTGSTSSISLYPHGLLGLRYTTASPLSFFGEVNAGPRINLGSANPFNFGGGARVGVDYTLR